MAKILFKYPSRARPDKFKETFRAYLNLLSGTHIYQWIISCDIDDKTMNTNEIKTFINSIPNAKVFYQNNLTKVKAINNDMEHMDPDTDIIILVSDDMVAEVKDFDDIIVRNMNEYFPNMDGSLHFNDGRVGKSLNTLVIMGKKLYDNFGYIYHPSYVSLWCDNEFHNVVIGMNKVVYIDQVIIRHRWTDYTGKDKLHFRNGHFYGRDKAVFEKRQKLGFR